MRKSVTMYCGVCNDDREFTPIVERRTLPVRGDSITADVPLVQCPVCKQTQFDPEPDLDPTFPFYAEYRRRHHMLAPREMREIRMQYNLSPEAFAKLLGMSPATIYRYEAGGLQDEVHDALILLCRDPKNVRTLLELRGDSLTALQHKRYKAATARRAKRGTPRRKAKKRALAA